MMCLPSPGVQAEELLCFLPSRVVRHEIAFGWCCALVPRHTEPDDVLPIGAALDDTALARLRQRYVVSPNGAQKLFVDNIGRTFIAIPVARVRPQ